MTRLEDRQILMRDIAQARIVSSLNECATVLS